MHRGLVAFATAIALAGLCAACGNGSCDDRRAPSRCHEAGTVVLRAVGYAVVHPTSDCSFDGRSTPNGYELTLIGRSARTTCHIDVTLDFGEQLSLDIPLTQVETTVCCGVQSTTYVSPSPPLELKAPPRY
jgi:hypothetical protein